MVRIEMHQSPTATVLIVHANHQSPDKAPVIQKAYNAQCWITHYLPNNTIIMVSLTFYPQDGDLSMLSN